MSRARRRSGRIAGSGGAAAVLLILLDPASRAAVATPRVPGLVLSIAPAPDSEGGIDHLEVELGIDVPKPEDRPVLRLPLVVNNVATAAESISLIAARDERGALRLAERHEGDPETGTRSWVPERAVEGKLTVRYRVPLEARSASRGAAPPLELRSEAGAFSGAGSTFLLLPETDRGYRQEVRWDLSRLPPKSAALSSFGAGDAALKAPAPASRLARTFFMAGTIGSYAPSGVSPFFAGWHGDPPFDAPALMEWTARQHRRFVDFFREPAPQPYGVFLRPNPVNPGGGVGLENSFVATFNENTDAGDLRLTLVHEMFHTFSPRLANPEGLESSWFSEGLAVFYQRALPFRFGEIDADAFLDNLNATAARYYTSAMAALPNSEVPARFWEDTRVRTLPYDRGALYFAELDQWLRSESGGSRSLDDLVLAMLETQRAGKSLGYADWEELLAAELGPRGVDHFRAMLAGNPPLPPSGAFGPCFRRITVPLRRYELGFDPRVLVVQPRIVRGLVPGSAAEQAGLRNGDEIVRPVPQDRIQGDQNAYLELEIRRGGRTFPLRYLPRGETVDAWQWERIGSVPETECAEPRQTE